MDIFVTINFFINNDQKIVADEPDLNFKIAS